MKVFILLFFLIYINALEEVSFSTAMNDLENLEKYMREYIKEKSSQSLSLTHLITCYIREGAYTGTEWSIAGGNIPEDLVNYIKGKDSEKGTNAQSCKTYREIVLPSNETIDFVHLFAVMNGIEYGKSYSDTYAHLVGWGGDTFQLLQDIQNQQGNLDELMAIAKTYFRIKGGFGPADFVSDIDAPILLKLKNDNTYFADIIRSYYKNKEYTNRINNFISLTFPSLKSKAKFREEIFNKYNSDTLIKMLECKNGIRNGEYNCLATKDVKPQYIQHQKAAVYVVSDYLAENYNEDINQNESTLLKLSLILLISIMSLIL